MDRELRIGIIGSGIAGLSAGLALNKAGFTQVRIYERDDCFDRRRQGYGLTMLQGLSALKRLGVYDAVKSIDTPSRSHYIFDCDGNIIGFFGTIFWPDPSSLTGKKKSKHNLHISRQNLRNILYQELNRLSPDAVQWDKRLISMEEGTEYDSYAWSLIFGNGDSRTVDLVLGCDGINSFVRRWKYPSEMDYPLKYLGIILVLGV